MENTRVLWNSWNAITSTGSAADPSQFWREPAEHVLKLFMFTEALHASDWFNSIQLSPPAFFRVSKEGRKRRAASLCCLLAPPPINISCRSKFELMACSHSTQICTYWSVKAPAGTGIRVIWLSGRAVCQMEISPQETAGGWGVEGAQIYFFSLFAKKNHSCTNKV